jgi:DNA (cytosine-5)-methyltransferase 1
MKKKEISYPIVDLFAGPGGLGEGFSALYIKGTPSFHSIVSIEHDESAHKTLLLRHFFRSFGRDKTPKEYYQYISGEITRDSLAAQYPEQWKKAEASALRISLGPLNHELVQQTINTKLGKTKKWALVGGPPCQAYSLVGRSRMSGSPDFEDDKRHFLYREYLKIIVDHRPPVFVMENVKGLLSASVKGEPVIQKIIRDLTRPKSAVGKSDNGLEYRLYSLSEKGEFSIDADPASFIVKAEEYGIPQARHRIFIVGIRSDIDVIPSTLKKVPAPKVKEIIGGLPRLRSGLSKEEDGAERWQQVIRAASTAPWYGKPSGSGEVVSEILEKYVSPDVHLPSQRFSNRYSLPEKMAEWFGDSRLTCLTHHDARSHMREDIYRYLFAAAYAKEFRVSPVLSDFPSMLLPKHKNVESGVTGKMFNDRFRVQVAGKPSTTITSHISKDGHYFIHYDPCQCRSLTVREAARLQTFPDNYFFEGSRTAQYHQVGNAVPAYLASMIARIIRDALERMKD